MEQKSQRPSRGLFKTSSTAEALRQLRVRLPSRIPHQRLKEKCLRHQRVAKTVSLPLPPSSSKRVTILFIVPPHPSLVPAELTTLNIPLWFKQETNPAPLNLYNPSISVILAMTVCQELSVGVRCRGRGRGTATAAPPTSLTISRRLYPLSQQQPRHQCRQNHLQYITEVSPPPQSLPLLPPPLPW